MGLTAPQFFAVVPRLEIVLCGVGARRSSVVITSSSCAPLDSGSALRGRGISVIAGPGVRRVKSRWDRESRLGLRTGEKRFDFAESAGSSGCWAAAMPESVLTATRSLG